jgi:hypothetical protein
MKIENKRIRLHFTHTTGGLIAKGGKLQGFAIAGADSVFNFAEAVIEGNDILVSQSQGLAPTQVRYAWADNPICNLYNGGNPNSLFSLPASPFRTTGPQLTTAMSQNSSLKVSRKKIPHAFGFEEFDGLGRKFSIIHSQL